MLLQGRSRTQLRAAHVAPQHRASIQFYARTTLVCFYLVFCEVGLVCEHFRARVALERGLAVSPLVNVHLILLPERFAAHIAGMGSDSQVNHQVAPQQLFRAETFLAVRTLKFSRLFGGTFATFWRGGDKFRTGSELLHVYRS